MVLSHVAVFFHLMDSFVLWWWWNDTWNKIVLLYFLQHFYSSDFCFSLSHSLYSSHVARCTPPPCLTFRCVSLASETKRKWWVYKKLTFCGGVIMFLFYLFLILSSKMTSHTFLNSKLVVWGRTFQFSVYPDDKLIVCYFICLEGTGDSLGFNNMDVFAQRMMSNITCWRWDSPARVCGCFAAVTVGTLFDQWSLNISSWIKL